MNAPFLICEFASATLSNLVKECFGSDFPDIIQRKQTKYIINYLDSLDAKTILLESDYVDKDYLEDYSRYYVKCFNQYGGRCARLHFFSYDFDHTEFSKIFNQYNGSAVIAKLQQHYLGFMVIKPLPKTFIGKTCLKLYPSFEGSSDKKIISRPYSANLFGVNLTVNSVAFQEQDNVLSACATTSIWCALHALDKNDTRSVPSCSEITLSAINHIVDSSNSFPNQGLTNKQIVRALDIQKLRNHQVNITVFTEQTKASYFQIIKSYLDSNIPVILGADVYQKNENALTYLAGHAVTILGYKDRPGEQALYLHDDRLGPFSKARFYALDVLFSGVDCQLKNNTATDWCISLQELSDEGEWRDLEQILIPDSLIIPNDTKVRIPSQIINNTCFSIVSEYDSFVASLPTNETPKLTYEIKLERLADIRTRIIKDTRVVDKYTVLTTSAARFLWSAVFSLNGQASMEVLFDSTDIPQGKAVTSIIKYDLDNCENILLHFNNLLADEQPLPESTKNNFLSAFIHALAPKESDMMDYLNVQYGELRAPKRLKKAEFINNKLQGQIDARKYYGRADKALEDDFKLDTSNQSFKIWAISIDGALLIGEEIEDKGHPTLTGFKPARISGELRKDQDGWFINAKSGRYSTDYTNTNDLLANARQKFLDVYNHQKADELRIEEYHPEK